MISDKDFHLLASVGQSSAVYSTALPMNSDSAGLVSHSNRSTVTQKKNATSQFLGTNNGQSNASLLLKSTFRYMLRAFKPPLGCTQLCNAVRTDSSIIVQSATLTLLPSIILPYERPLPKRVLQRVRSSASFFHLPISSCFLSVIQQLLTSSSSSQPLYISLYLECCYVIRIFHLHNPSCRTMALESTQLLTGMSTRNYLYCCTVHLVDSLIITQPTNVLIVCHLFQITFLKHIHCSYMFRQHIAYHHQGAHIVPS